MNIDAQPFPYTSQRDGITNAIMVIDYGHHEIHGGSAFTVNYSRVTDATDGHRSGIYLKTPAAGGKLIHMVASFACSTAATVSICEAPTIASNVGTHAVVVHNRYRDSIVPSVVLDNASSPAANKVTTLTEAQIAGDGTWNVGTVIRSAPLSVGTGPKPAGGDGRDTQEFILKANTKYVFLITNTAASANTHHILLDWYEHTNVV